MLFLNTVNYLLIGLGLVYFTTMVVLGLAFCRRAEQADAQRTGKRWFPRPRAADAATPPEPGGPVPDTVYVLLPALNESAVIGATVHRVIMDSRVQLILIDDASDDETVEVARAAARQAGAERRLLVHTRRLPAARLGKGPALNAGYATVDQEVRRRGLDPANVVVCVMDADGRLSDGALDEVLPLFADQAVGGVQLAVRIRNRTTWLTRVQDMEFWALSGVSQFGRVRSGTVSLGGNGQFTRLSALRSVGPRPWAAALTEDLELALELAVAGWRLTTTPRAHVDQQAIGSLRPLLRQRTRWFQGHMAAIRYMPRIWNSPRVTHAAAMEMMLYLLVPWTLVLPWSIVFHVNLALMVAQLVEHGGLDGLGPDPVSRAQALILLYVESFLPNLAAAYLYKRRDPSASWLMALTLGHLLVPGNYIAYTACWRALIRTLRGQTAWTKTQHVPEAAGTGVPAPAGLDATVPMPAVHSVLERGDAA